MGREIDGGRAVSAVADTECPASDLSIYEKRESLVILRKSVNYKDFSLCAGRKEVNVYCENVRVCILIIRIASPIISSLNDSVQIDDQTKMIGI